MKETHLLYSKSLTEAKFFAVLMLSLQEALIPSIDNKLRVFKCMIKTFNTCIDEQQYSTAKKVQDSVEKFQGLLESIKGSFDTKVSSIYYSLTTDLYLMDMQYAITQGDLNLAKFYESKVDFSNGIKGISNTDAVNIARILYNTGLKLFEEGNPADAYHFSQRCSAIIEKLSIDDNMKERIIGLKNIEQSCLILLTKCCLKKGDSVSLEEGQRLINLLQKLSPNNIEPFKLLTELLQRYGFENEKIEEVLMQMIMTVPMDELNFKEILALLNRHSSSDPVGAKNCLLYIFNNKIVFGKSNEVAELCLTSLLWMITVQSKEISNEIRLSEAKALLELAERKFVGGISRECLSCSITLFWSLGKKNMKEQRYKQSIDWFSLSLHRFLSNHDAKLNNDDIGKIYRNILKCYTEMGEFAKLQDTYDSMTEKDKSHPLTQYYMFNSNLTLGHHDCALQNLENLSASPSPKTLNVLALCVIKSQDSNTPNILNDSIGKLLKHSDVSKDKDSIVLPVALRSCIYLTVKQFEASLKEKNSSVILEFLNLLENFYSKTLNFINTVDDSKTVSNTSQSISSNNVTVSDDDLEWFASTSYNIGICCLDKELEFESIVFFDNCNSLIKIMLTRNITLADNLTIWSTRAAVLQCVAQSISIKKQSNKNSNISWVRILSNIECVWETVERFADIDVYRDCHFQSFAILTESLAELGQWDKLNHHISKLESTKENIQSELLDFVINLVTTKTVPTSEKLKLFEIILDKSFRLISYISSVNICKWLRLLVENMLLSTNDDDSKVNAILLKYIEMFYSTVRLERNDSDKERIPSYEIEWFATTSWNKGVSIMMSITSKQTELGDFEDWQFKIGDEWCKLAMKLSEFTNERLESQFNEMYPQLVEVAKKNMHNYDISTVSDGIDTSG